MTKISRAAIAIPLVLACASCEEPPASVAPSASVKAATSAPASSASSAKLASSVATQPSASASSAPAADLPPVPPEGAPTCKKTNEKVQAKDAYPITGLTTKGFKKELAIGFGSEGAKVLVVDSTGGTRVLDVAAARRRSGRTRIRACGAT